jgi:hypothetical protein
MDDDPSMNPGAGGPRPGEKSAASGLVSLQYAEANRRAAAERLQRLRNIKTWEEADTHFKEDDDYDEDLYESMKEAFMASEELDDAAAAGGRRKKKRKHLVGGVNPITMLITIIDALFASATKFKRNVGANLQVLMNGTVARIMATGGDPELAKKIAGYIWAASKYLVGAVAVRAVSNDLAKGTTGVTGLVVLTVIRSILLLVPDNALKAVPGVLEIAIKTGGLVEKELRDNPSKYAAAIVAALGVKVIGSLTEKANRQKLYTRISEMFGPLEGLFEQKPFDEAVQGLAVALESANLAPKPVIAPGILPRTKVEAVAKAGAAAAAAVAVPPAAAKRPSPTPAEVEERKKASKAAFVASMKQFFDTHRDRTPEEVASDAAIEASLAEAAAELKAAANAAPKKQVDAAVQEAEAGEAGYQAAEAAEEERADLRQGDRAKESVDSAADRRAAAAAAGTGLTDMSAKPKVEGGKRRKSTRKVRRSARRSFRRSARRLSRRKRMNKA